MKTCDQQGNSVRPPNILFITTDTQGRDMISAYVDRPCVETPHIDALAREGVLFENSFCASPVCTPARSAWYTGIYPNRNGAWSNGLSTYRHVPMLAEVMTAGGYDCHHIGKWHLEGGGYDGNAEAGPGFEQESWYDLHSFKLEAGSEDEVYPNRFGAWNKGFFDRSFCYGNRVASRAIDLLKNTDRTDKPLFLAVEFDEPHGPYICPPPFRGRFNYTDLPRPSALNACLQGKPKLQQDYSAWLKQGDANPGDLPGYYLKYYECNSYVDDEIGRVISAARQHLAGETVIIFTSDHGDHLGAFGLGAKGPTMYDLTCAVPLIISAPHLEMPSQRIPGLVSGIDIFPTILNFAGITPPASCAGQSLIPLLTGESAAIRDEVFIEYNRFGAAHDQDDGFFPIRCVRTTEWKLSINLFDRDELYNLAEDPDELTNRIDDPALKDIRDRLHDHLIEWQRQTRDTFRSPQWVSRPWRDGARPEFQGLRTTGWFDRWPTGDFNEPVPSKG
jgi:uncharacterized sulfatase